MEPVFEAPNGHAKKARGARRILWAVATVMSMGTTLTHAAIYQTNISFGTALNSSAPGFPVEALSLNPIVGTFVSESVGVNLANLGDSFNSDIFIIRPTAPSFAAGFETPSAFSLNFDLGSYGIATVTGSTFATDGVALFGNIQFDGPTVIGVDGGNAIAFSLGNATFGANGAVIGFSAELVSAVPEPGTWALMLAGLAGIGFVARRQQSATAEPAVA